MIVAMTTTTLESSLISPLPSNDAVELSVPLTFLDIIWLWHQSPIRRVLFYEHPSCSREFFAETLVPKLRESLSSTLASYLPVSGRLLWPTNRDDPTLPFIRCRKGDAVPFTAAESDRSFDELVKDQPRDADDFYDFVPPMPPFEEEPGYRIIPLAAFRATLFRGRGFCVGFSNHHALCDGNSFVRFVKAWASACKHGGGGGCSLPPLFDRSVFKRPREMDAVFWKGTREVPLNPPSFPLPTKRFRATYTLRRSDIDGLKSYALSKKPNLGYVSSFAAAASYAWTCFAKSVPAEEGAAAAADDDAEELFSFSADIRSRVDPPLPENYFGNFITAGYAVVGNRILTGEDGFAAAAEEISSHIKKRLNAEYEVLKEDENWASLGSIVAGKRKLSVSGSPKFDLYEVDFGWGKPEKLEVVSIDGESYAMSLSKSRVSEGGVEIGFSLPMEAMEAFNAVFEDGLKKMML